MNAPAAQAPASYAPGARLPLGVEIAARPEQGQERMTYVKSGQVTFRSVFLWAPLLKVLRLPAESKVAAGFAALLTFMWESMYWSLLPGLVIASALDWQAGRQVAKRGKSRRKYNSQLSTIGLHAKVSALGITVLFWYVEWWGARHDVFDSGGWFAVALVFALIAAELESYNSHRLTLGKRPIPLLSEVLAVMRGLLAKRAGVPLPPPPNDEAPR